MPIEADKRLQPGSFADELGDGSLLEVLVRYSVESGGGLPVDLDPGDRGVLGGGRSQNFLYDCADIS